MAIHLVSAREMGRINGQFLGHVGSTDVITFDQGSTSERLKGELFISIADAVKQAVEFRTRWSGELARYVIHGLLHLNGYDDLEPAARRVMKRQETRLLRLESRRRSLLERPVRGRRGSPGGS